ncbi:hypothetical protein Tco_0491688 [Tanacetum coccineum]
MDVRDFGGWCDGRWVGCYDEMNGGKTMAKFSGGDWVYAEWVMGMGMGLVGGGMGYLVHLLWGNGGMMLVGLCGGGGMEMVVGIGWVVCVCTAWGGGDVVVWVGVVWNMGGGLGCNGIGGTIGTWWLVTGVGVECFGDNGNVVEVWGRMGVVYYKKIGTVLWAWEGVMGLGLLWGGGWCGSVMNRGGLAWG